MLVSSSKLVDSVTNHKFLYCKTACSFEACRCYCLQTPDVSLHSDVLLILGIDFLTPIIDIYLLISYSFMHSIFFVPLYYEAGSILTCTGTVPKTFLQNKNSITSYIWNCTDPTIYHRCHLISILFSLTASSVIEGGCPQIFLFFFYIQGTCLLSSTVDVSLF